MQFHLSARVFVQLLAVPGLRNDVLLLFSLILAATEVAAAGHNEIIVI